MKLRRTAAGYAIIVGLAMAAVWVVLLVTGQDPQLQAELRTMPFSIGMAIASDLVTAAALLIAGFGLLKKSRWAVKVFLISMGLLFYSVINAAGLYGQRGDIPFVSMLALIFMLAVVFTALALRVRSEGL